MKFQKTILATAVAVASVQVQAQDINIISLEENIQTVNAGSSLTVQSGGIIDTSWDSSPDNGNSGTGGDDAVVVDPGVTVNSITVDAGGTINTSGDGIYTESGSTVTGSIINNGTILADGQSWGGGIFVDGSVQGAVTNNGTITVMPGGCEDVAKGGGCIASGMGTFGNVAGGIVNTGTINTSKNSVNGTFRDAGILVLGAVDTAGTVVNDMTTVTGGITNSGDITSENYAIYVMGGSTVNGNITNQTGGTLTGGETGILLSAEAAQISTAPPPNDVIVSILGEDTASESPLSVTLNGNIVNNGTITGQSTDGITLYGAVTVNGSIINTGLIQAQGTDGVGAIYVVDGASVSGAVVNTGTLSVVAAQSDAQFQAAVFVGPSSSVRGVDNRAGGTIQNLDANGLAIAAFGGGSLGTVKNAGSINGRVDFGSAGGTYEFAGGSQTGQILNASTIRISNYGQSGINANASALFGDLIYSGQIVVDAIGVDLGNGQTRIDNGVLYVAGNANVSGATVNVNVSSEEFIKPGDSLDVIHTPGTLTTTGTLVADNSALLAFDLSQETVADVEQSYTALKATAKSALLEDIGQEAGIDTTSTGFENTANVFVAVQSIDQSTLESGSDLDQLLTALNTEGLSAEETVAAAASLDAETVEGSSVGSQAADAAAAGTVNGRMTALREGAQTGMVAGDLLSVHGFWVQGYYNDTEQDQRDGISGFDADTSGIAMGVDAAVNDQVNAGMAISWANTGVDSDGAEKNTMDIDSYRFTLYGAYNAENYYVDGQIAYAANEYDNKRNISAGTYGSVAKSNHDGDQYSLRVRGGYPMALESGFYVTPRAGLEYTYLSEDDYKEKGAGNAGLEVSTDDVEVLLAKVGAKVAYPIVTESETTWIPEVSMDVTHDFIGDEVELDSNFLGAAAAAFVTQGANVEQTGVVAGVRIRAFSQSNFSFSAGYDYLYKKDYAGQSLNATVRYDF